MKFPYRAFELNRYPELDNPPTGEVWPDLESNPDMSEEYQNYEMMTAVNLYQLQKTASLKIEPSERKLVCVCVKMNHSMKE